MNAVVKIFCDAMNEVKKNLVPMKTDFTKVSRVEVVLYIYVD